jgi:hypothetical protein
MFLSPFFIRIKQYITHEEFFQCISPEKRKNPSPKGRGALAKLADNGEGGIAGRDRSAAKEDTVSIIGPDDKCAISRSNDPGEDYNAERIKTSGLQNTAAHGTDGCEKPSSIKRIA